MQDIQTDFAMVVGQALMDSLVKVALSPSFLKMLPDEEFADLRNKVMTESTQRGSFFRSEATVDGNALTPEEQCAALREQFGRDGMLKTGDLLKGETAPIITDFIQGEKKAVPRFFDYNFPMLTTSVGFQIMLNDPKVRAEANALTREAFRRMGAITCYNETDTIEYFVTSTDPDATVLIKNVTQNQTYSISTTLKAFNEWFKTTTIRLMEA